MRVKDSFELKEAYQTGHPPGLVIVLDLLITKEARNLVGQVAFIRTPDGQTAHYCIDEAKEHGPVNSLFFRDLKQEMIPIDSVVAIHPPGSPEAPVVPALSLSPEVMKGTNP